jgi:hypothetical protein
VHLIIDSLSKAVIDIQAWLSCVLRVDLLDECMLDVDCLNGNGNGAAIINDVGRMQCSLGAAKLSHALN